MRKAACWAVAIGALGFTDYLLDRRHDGSTLTEAIRLVFRTDTDAGRATFTLALVGGGVVFHRHITRSS